jgi:hypothetical protein
VKKQGTGKRGQGTGDKQEGTGGQGRGHREEGTVDRQEGTGDRGQGTGDRQEGQGTGDSGGEKQKAKSGERRWGTRRTVGHQAKVGHQANSGAPGERWGTRLAMMSGRGLQPAGKMPALLCAVGGGESDGDARSGCGAC